MNLLHRAFMEGRLDPKDARPFDRLWWIKVKWVTDWLEAQSRNKMRELKHQLNCSLLDYAAGDKAVDMHWDQALLMQALIRRTILPWTPDETHRMTRSEYNRLDQLWKAKWGDYKKDPQTQEAIQRTVAHLNKMAGRR